MSETPPTPTLDLHALFPAYAAMIRQGKVVRVPDDLPADATAEREYCRQVGLKLNLTIPLVVILISADKGLCGSLNSNLFRVATQFDPETTVFITAGRRASQFVARGGRRLAAEFVYGDPPQFPEALAIAACARDLFLNREVDEVQVVATRFVNTLTQQADALEYLPVGEIKGIPTGESPMDRESMANWAIEMQFEPNAESLLGYLLARYLNIYVYLVMLNARASEHSARMVSMQSATDTGSRGAAASRRQLGARYIHGVHRGFGVARSGRQRCWLSTNACG